MSAKKCSALMKQGGAILTLSYLGSQRVTPNYNVMGVAKAAWNHRLDILQAIWVKMVLE